MKEDYKVTTKEEMEKIPLHMRMDYERRNENILNNKELCEYCGGTGNEFFSMYKACSKCNGKGFLLGEVYQS